MTKPRPPINLIRLLVLSILLTTACSAQIPAEISDIQLLTTPTLPPKPTVIPIPTSSPTVTPYSIAGFEAFISAAEQSRRADRPNLVNDYMAGLTHGPLTENGMAVFIWQGAAQQLHVHGDLNSWQLDRALPMKNLPDTDFWYLRVDLSPEARIDYIYRIDNGRELLDPLNPNTQNSPFGLHSKLIMPAFMADPVLENNQSPLPAEQTGSLSNHTLDSVLLNQTRTFFVYSPAVAVQAGQDRFPSIYVQDGADYLNLTRATEILDRLIAAGEIPPIVAVFVPPIDRMGDYDRNDSYVNFLTDELQPFIERQYRTSPASADTAILGSSEGGVAALYAGIAAPGHFGHVAAHSAPVFMGDNNLTRQITLSESEGRPISLYLAVGQFETQTDVGASSGNPLEANQRLKEALEQKGYSVQFDIRPEGRGWGMWEAEFAATLQQIWDTPSR